MRRVTIAVIGNGKTSRANVEALLNDTIESFDETHVALVYDKAPSEGVVWARQYSESKSIPYKEYSDLNFSTFVADNKDRETKFFILWDDEDFECVEAIRCSQKHNIMSFDLTNGLVAIKSITTDIKPRQFENMPEVETKVNPTDYSKKETKYESSFVRIEKDQEEEEDYDDEEDDDEEYESSDIILEAVEEIAKIFAVAIASAIKEAMEKGPDESK